MQPYLTPRQKWRQIWMSVLQLVLSCWGVSVSSVSHWLVPEEIFQLSLSHLLLRLPLPLRIVGWSCLEPKIFFQITFIHSLFKFSMSFLVSGFSLCGLSLESFGNKCYANPTFGSGNSPGILFKTTICGLSGNFVNILSRRGRFDLPAVFPSLAFSCLIFFKSSSISRLSRITATNKLNTIWNPQSVVPKAQNGNSSKMSWGQILENV